MTDKKFHDIFSQWIYNNYTSCGKTPPGWVPNEPCPYEFATSPWEGEYSLNNVGEYVQYRHGEWVKVNDAK